MVTTPQDVLPDGAETVTAGGRAVRKGSVAAFVANARRLAELEPGVEHDQVAAALRSLAPDLEAVGVFEVFAVRAPAVRAAIA